ncbi:MAG: dipeptidase [Anaerolineales bacterium]|nr:dipeptidase [Anaerolineales bacterium]
MEKAIAFARSNRNRILRDLNELLEIPSISTLSEYAAETQRAAEWLLYRLLKLGFEARLLPTEGPPLVYGFRAAADPSAPVVLLYGHYDVQPPEPLEEWVTPPFSPSVREENLYARGASDMKGPLMAYLAALESILAVDTLPVNVKVIFEGEEEVGSPHLETALIQNKQLLRCDAVLNCDTLILRPDLPTIVYGLRGLAYFELRLETADHDLHSGLFGGVVPNAGQILCELIAGMHDAKGRVTLPGFYDDVLPLDAEERAQLARVPWEEDEFLAQSTGFGINGEEGYTVVERIGARPTLEVNGLLCGFTGEGSKTVLPARSMAKLSMRLVPNQKPEAVKRQLEEYLRAHAPAWLRWEVTDLAGSPAGIVRRDTREMQAAIRALEGAFGVRPVFAREGGSVPVVSLIQEVLGRESIMMGISLPDDNLHAPNEKLHLPILWRGIEAYIRFFYELKK